MEQQQTENTKRTCYLAYLRVVGVKKRCRKTERHFFNLKKSMPENYSEEMLQAIKDNGLRHLNEVMKSYQSAELYLQYSEVDGHVVSFELFDPKHRTFKLTT